MKTYISSRVETVDAVLVDGDTALSFHLSVSHTLLTMETNKYINNG